MGVCVHLVCFEHRHPAPGARGTAAHGREGASGERAAPNLDALEASWPGRRRLGALLAEGPRAGDVVDLNSAFAVELALRDVGAPEAEADSLLPSDPMLFLERFDGTLPYARAVLEFVLDCLGRWDAPDLVRAGALYHRRDIRLVAPVPAPGKILAVARNYPAHAAELGQTAAPEEPVLFLKATSAVIGPEDDIVIPAASTQSDFECELAVVIGRRARRLPAYQALSCVAGYTIANDVSARDFQGQRGQHFIGKSCDSFAPLGPALVTADEIDDPQDLGLTTRVSGETMQCARTKEMIFPVAELIAFASRLMTLEPGDVLLTGTPAGVGMARTPPRWLRDGDMVEIEIERLGRLRNYVRQEKD
jgi:2-keto-4-pentenoate hydratase/2-oxohepta-3-ene-1,7-dioic acid hydratase in catechol pathway